MALGVVIAAHSVVAGVLAAVYMVSTLTAAVRTEEAFLRGRFGGAYDEYRRSEGEEMDRRFSVGAGVAQQGIPRRYRPADWVCLPCLAGRDANIIMFCGHADAQVQSARRGQSRRGAVSSVVEHRLYTPAVAGSSPAPPTNLALSRKSKGKVRK